MGKGQFEMVLKDCPLLAMVLATAAVKNENENRYQWVLGIKKRQKEKKKSGEVGGGAGPVTPPLRGDIKMQMITVTDGACRSISSPSP
ncbi:hypothetical protein HZH68_005849 [Vespula germanica]|uniref:Uncharacterized protein n=1 Tax=Vespula germanica TaxID=30212 RepID=A0A834KH02_VESGE|nr:hypothetical protein HZH68_005849 [Vespula germanica]